MVLVLIYTHKSARVVVADSLGVSKGLQQRVGLQDDVFNMLSTEEESATATMATVCKQTDFSLCLCVMT